MQSATVTASRTPQSRVAWPSTPSSTIHPGGGFACHLRSVPWTWWLMTTVGNRDSNARRKARHRVITCPAGSSLHRPRENPPARVVMPATTPCRAAHSDSSSRGTAASPAGTSTTMVACGGVVDKGRRSTTIFEALDFRAQRAEPLIDALVAALDLSYVVDHRIPLGRQGGEQNGHAGADVGALDLPSPQLRRARDHGAMWIAEHDARSHADQLVHEKEARLEHLLEHKQRPFALRRHHDRDRHQVGGERRPGSVLELRDVAPEIGADAALLVLRDDQRIAVDPRPHAESVEGVERGAQVLGAHALDPHRPVGDRGQPDERAHLDM